MEKAWPLKVRFTPDALRELDAIITTIRAESFAGARRVQRRIDDIVDQIGTFAGASGRTRDPTIRKAVIRPFPYLLFFRVDEDEIVVTSVRHGARDPSTMPGAPDPGDT